MSAGRADRTPSQAGRAPAASTTSALAPALAPSLAPPPEPGHGNRLLATPEAAPLLPLLVRQTVSPGQVLQDAGAPAGLVHFPMPGTVLAMVAPGRDGRVAEVAMIGAEGAAGPLLAGADAPAGFRTTVHVGGGAWQVAAAQLAGLLAQAPGLRHRLQAYAAALLAQVMQSSACAALHAVEARACGWLLAAEDRVGRPELPVTQEYLADMLGVRRTTITRVIAGLEGRGLVHHRRGRILVLDRAGLEAAGCACHGQIRRQFAALAPGLYAIPGATPPEG